MRKGVVFAGGAVLALAGAVGSLFVFPSWTGAPAGDLAEKAERAEKATRAIITLVRRHHPRGEALSEREIRAALSHGEVVPGDPHSALLSEEIAARAMEREGQGETGLFLFLGRRERGESRLEVFSVFPGSPAEAAGILPGSRLVSIDTRPAGRLHPDAAAALLAGPAGSSVRIAYWEPEEQEGAAIRERTVTRAFLPAAPARARLLAGPVALLRIDRFCDRTVGACAEALDRLSPAPSGILLDLTDLSGEHFDSAVAVAALLKRLRVAVLVNRRTALAAELLAARLVERGAPLIGEPPFGSRAVVDRFPFPGGMLILTVRFWEPAAPLPVERLASGEEAVAAALELLARQ